MNTGRMTKLSLFSGIMGDDLASEWAGIKTVCCVEIDPFCQAVIKKHYPDMPIIGDIHDVTKEKVKEVSGYEWVDIISGGDPCQPRSIAGERRGREDDRDLWKDMFRVVCEFKPTWVVNENPTGRLTMDFHEVLSDLESQGYETRSFVIPACAVNAPHCRDRIYIIAHRISERCNWGCSRGYSDRNGIQEGEQARQKSWSPVERCDENAPDAPGIGKRKQTDETQSVPGGGETRQGTSGGNRVTPHAGSRRKQQSEGCIREIGRRITDSSRPTDTNPNTEGRQGFRQSGERARELIAAQSAWQASWLEVATSLCGMDARFSDWLDRCMNDVIYSEYENINKGTKQNLSHMREAIQTQEIWEQIRGLFPIFEKEDLLKVLWELSQESERQDNLSSEGKEIQGASLRALWDNSEYKLSSQRRQYQEQSAGKLTDTLPFLPYEDALAITQIGDYLSLAYTGVNSHRVARLKALGNAQVPQQIYPIYKAIMEVESLVGKE